mmetsp:Transcript_22733/g.47332  ORF Transcript_22733/g.47332 Transcript_22733/m.47332 type:complete len:716 (-) Transcript_22733:35-2182(-)
MSRPSDQQKSSPRLLKYLRVAEAEFLDSRDDLTANEKDNAKEHLERLLGMLEEGTDKFDDTGQALVDIGGVQRGRLPMEERRLRRRRSLAGALDAETMKDHIDGMILSAVKEVGGFDNASKQDIVDLSDSYRAAIINSSPLIERDIEVWFDRSWPTEGMSQREIGHIRRFFIIHAENMRPMVKMSRIGVAAKISLTLLIGYVDMVTDILATLSYHRQEGRQGVTYAMTGCILLTLFTQAAFTFVQYKKKSWMEKGPRTVLALFGFAPILEGYNSWRGVNDSDTMLSATVMYAVTKAIEIAFESIPESIVQIHGLLGTARGEIQVIQLASVLSSILSAAFIIMEANYSITQGQALKSPADPYYKWITALPNRRLFGQLGLFLALATYFFVFVYASALVTSTSYGFGVLLAYHGIVFLFICAAKALKGELFGYSLMAHPSTINNYVVPVIVNSVYYILTCATPLLIAVSPMELGGGLFSKLVVWNALVNGAMVFAGLRSLKDHPFLSMTSGMLVYIGAMLLMAVGLVLFFCNMNDGFDVSLFWKEKSGRAHMRDCWCDKKIWRKSLRDKDAERHYRLCKIHPTYLPFELIVPWICEDLLEKYEYREDRPEWLDSDKFIKRVATCFRWHGEHIEEVDAALVKLFGLSGADLQADSQGRLVFVKKSRSFGNLVSSTLSGSFSKESLTNILTSPKSSARKVKPEGERGEVDKGEEDGMGV